MSSSTKPRRWFPAAWVAALAAGAGTAVLASGAGSQPMITLGDNPGEEITVYGSRLGDTITYGGYTDNITVAANRTITSLRNDCDVEPTFSTSAFCDRELDYSKLESRLGDGPDHIEFYDSFDAPGFRILGRGGSGGDSLSGAEKKDEFAGGRGGDTLIGLEGNDDLSGGRGTDTCDGGSGNDHLTGCEQ
jgi:Ca2+-binding RTX toxin-like protein